MLGAVDDVVIAVAHGPRLHRAEVGARARARSWRGTRPVRRGWPAGDSARPARPLQARRMLDGRATAYCSAKEVRPSSRSIRAKRRHGRARRRRAPPACWRHRSPAPAPARGSARISSGGTCVVALDLVLERVELGARRRRARCRPPSPVPGARPKFMVPASAGPARHPAGAGRLCCARSARERGGQARPNSTHSAPPLSSNSLSGVVAQPLQLADRAACPPARPTAPRSCRAARRSARALPAWSRAASGPGRTGP